ncbi:MAG: dihydrodipicolinate synthase family protein [Clostridia bacterium]|nr:dihydrodipicolinate synthase family protein [Clostridia bacterium]
MDRHAKALEILKRGTVIPATPLVLDADRKYDEARQRRLIRYYLEAGSGGIATAVHSTQFAIRDPKVNLLETVIRTVADEVAKYEAETGKTIVKVAGVCGKTEQAVREAELAKSLGYDAVLASPGGLSALSEAEIIERTKAVADVMPVIGFYLQPSVGGRIFSYEYWQAICEIPNVVAIKCAPFNRYLTLDVVRACAMSSRADDIVLYTGNDDNIIVDLLTEYKFEKHGKTVCKRFEGGLLGHWSIWTHSVVKLFERIKVEGPTPELLTLAADVTECNRVVFDFAHNFAGCIPGIHEILRRQGFLEGTWCIDPEETLSPGQSEEIDRILRDYPQMNDDAFAREFLERYSLQS